MLVQHGLRHARRLCDVVHRRRVVAASREELERDVEQLAAPASGRQARRRRTGDHGPQIRKGLVSIMANAAREASPPIAAPCAVRLSRRSADDRVFGRSVVDDDGTSDLAACIAVNASLTPSTPISRGDELLELELSVLVELDQLRHVARARCTSRTSSPSSSSPGSRKVKAAFRFEHTSMRGTPTRIASPPLRVMLIVCSMVLRGR